MSGTIQVATEGHVATIVIDNPGKRNAMSQAMWIAMGDAVLDLSTNTGLRCIVLRGAGDEAFGSGAEIGEFATLRASREQALAFARHGHRAMHALRDCPIPTLAAIRGACVGGALELAAFCDIRLCSDDSKFGVPIARLGATLAYAELEGLIRLAGPVTAAELLLEGRIIGALEAQAKGIVNRSIAPESFDTEVAATVARICGGAPLAARWHKRFIARLRSGTPLTETDIAEGYACFDTLDYKTGFEAFLAKKEPHFLGK